MNRPTTKAAILGNSDSIFVQSLAKEWADRGLSTVVVTREPVAAAFDDRVRIVHIAGCRPWWTRPLRVVNPLLRWIEARWPRWFLRRYQRATGRSEPPAWQCCWVDAFWDSFACATAVRREQPDFVFAQELAAYGMAAGRCRGIPRILFPWGADIFLNVETSPFVDRMVRYAVRNCELLVPSSQSATEQLVRRLGADDSRVRPVSWGVNLSQFRQASAAERIRVTADIGFPADGTILMNCRRFVPLWGATETLNAFITIAQRFEHTYFVLLAGAGTEQSVAAARERLSRSGLARRFYFADGNVPLQRCAELMSVADIAVSLLGTGDMRSSSVLQAAAAGGVPVLAESPEYRFLQTLGFQALFADGNDDSAIVAALSSLVQNPQRCEEMRTANQRYLAEYEDSTEQMNRLLAAIDEVVAATRR